MSEPVVNARELSRLVREHRTRAGLSLRAGAEQSGVPFNTLARVEKGHLPDLANFARLARWAGFDPDVILGRTQVREDDPVAAVRAILHADPTLNENAAESIAGLVASMHANLARPSSPVVHVHAAQTFTPAAGAMVGDLLRRMSVRLAEEGI